MINGGRRSLDTIMAIKLMGEKHKIHKEHLKSKVQDWDTLYKFEPRSDSAIEASKAIERWEKEHYVFLAERFRDLALANGGFQVKLCQTLAHNTALLSSDVRAPLRECCEKAWMVPLSTILPVIEGKKRGLGCDYHHIFDTLEPRAMAAASIAQVHRATLRQPRGLKVLVKVQHAGVRNSLRADVAILPYMVRLLDKLHPGHGMRPLMYLLSSMLQQEVDFRIEGANRDRLAAIVQRSGISKRSRFSRLRFPRVFWDYCAESVMVQEYMEGAVSLGDRRVVENLGIPFSIALAEVASFFAECCFVHGYMHNDLHFGNILVRPNTEAADKQSKPAVQAFARRLLRVQNSTSVAVACLYIFVLAGAALVARIVIAIASNFAWTASPLIHTGIISMGLAANIACRIWNVVTCVVFACCAPLIFFLGNDLGDLGFSELGQTFLKRVGPSLVRRAEKFISLHQSVRTKTEKRIAEVADVRFELIIIDHGFHTHVSYEHRLAWCKVWAGIGLCDEELLREGCADFGLQDNSYRHMTMILAFFPYPAWRERRFCSMPELFEYLKARDENGFHAAQKTKNQRLPAEFHLMHRTSQQIAAHFNAGYGLSYESSFQFLMHMAKFALLGLRFRNRKASEFPLPEILHTADKSWFDAETPVVEEQLRSNFFWDSSMSSEIDQDSSIYGLLAKYNAAKEQRLAYEAEQVAQEAMDVERRNCSLSEEFIAKAKKRGAVFCPAMR